MDVKLAVGDKLILIALRDVSVQPVVVLVVTSVTIFVPAVEYTMPVGFCKVDVAGVAPAPKSHVQLTPLAVPVLVKSIDTGSVHWGAVDEKLATGVALILIVCVELDVQPNWLEVTSVTTFGPEEA